MKVVFMISNAFTMCVINVAKNGESRLGTFCSQDCSRWVRHAPCDTVSKLPPGADSRPRGSELVGVAATPPRSHRWRCSNFGALQRLPVWARDLWNDVAKPRNLHLLKKFACGLEDLLLVVVLASWS